MDSASDEHESSAEEGPVARGPRPRSSKNRAAEARAQQHFENIRNEGHSRTHIGNAYNTYHITERRHELQQETQGLTLKEALAFPLMRFRHDDIRAAYEGSCEWLFQTPAYNRWCDQTLQGENYGLWWITGSPGTGKSTIVKELLKRSYVSRTDEKIISYFFNAKAKGLQNNSKGLQNNAKGMYQSLLFQMVNDSPHLQTTPSSEMLREYRSGEWPLERLKELFRDVVGSLEGTSVACYIDAVDESQDESGGGGSGEDILQNLEELAVFAYRHTLTLRICISSRMLSDTLLLHSERLTLDDETGHIASIQKFAFAKLGLSDHDFKSILANCIASSSHGGYQWAMESIRTLNKDKDVEDRVRLHIKLASMIATTEVPEDQARLMELQLSLTSNWLKPAQPSQINAQLEVSAVSDATSNSVHQSTQPKPGQEPSGTGRSTPSNVAARVVGAQDFRADFRSSARQHNPRPKPSNTVPPGGSQSSGSGRMPIAPTKRPVAPKARSAMQSTTRQETPGNTRALDYRPYRPRVQPSQDTKGPVDRPRDSKRLSQTPIRHPSSLSAGSTPLPGQESSTENSSSPNQKGDAFIPPRCRKAQVHASTGTDSPMISTPAVMRRDAHQTQLTSPAGLDTIDGSSRRDAEGCLEGPQSTSPCAEYADEWFLSIRQHAHALFETAPPKNKDWKPVRVAIIGTGLTTHSEYLDLSMAEELDWMIVSGKIMYKDFTGFRNHYDNGWRGLDGTWCTLLLLQVAPHVELHIANVVNQHEAAQMPDRVADAIAWAIYYKVDIISMPFGWDAEVPKVDKLIDAARREGILIFAATSNDRGAGRQHEVYPANHPTVHGIHSWGGPGCSSRMNLQAFKDKPCFTFPGEQVTILTDSHQPLKDTGRRSGTAFATAVATGSAALVLQLVRQQLTGPVAKEVEWRLKKYEGMSEVFRAMSGEPSADGYYHVRPWTMLGMHKPILGVGSNESHQWFTLMQILRVLGRFGDYEDPVI